MKDFIKDYRKRKMIWNFYIILSAFIMAFTLNFFVLDWTNLENNLKTSILDSSSNSEIKADIFTEIKENKIILKNSKEMKNVKSISFSIAYDNSKIEILEWKSNLEKPEILGEKWSWIETFIINFNEKNIFKNEILAEINFKKLEETNSRINLLNANFTDSEENIFELTTSWVNL